MSGNAIASWVFGSLLLVFLVVAFFLVPKLTRDQRRIMAIISALLAGLLGFFVAGVATVQVDAELATGVKLSIQAGGAAAFAVIALLVWFFAMPGDESGEDHLPADPGGVWGPTAEKIVNRYERDLADRDSQIEQLKAALARVEIRADEGDDQAGQAIAQARESGDVTKLQAVLIAEADRRGDAIREQMTDYLALCREIAAIAFLRGDIVEAERRLQIVLRVEPDDLDAVNRMGRVLNLRGDLPAAEIQYRRLLDLAPNDDSVRATALGNLGLIERMRGNLDAAEKLHRESLEITGKLGDLEKQAVNLGNLGVIEGRRGNLDAAERLLRESLEIDRKLGRLEGQAGELGNLGLIERMRGNLDVAGELQRESLEIDRKLGRLEGQANALGNLGLIEWTRGNLDAAEKLLREAQKISRKLGWLEGQASDLGNLGIIAEQRGDVAEARRLWGEARDLFARIGMEPERKQVQGWIDRLGDG